MLRQELVTGNVLYFYVDPEKYSDDELLVAPKVISQFDQSSSLMRGSEYGEAASLLHTKISLYLADINSHALKLLYFLVSHGAIDGYNYNELRQSITSLEKAVMESDMIAIRRGFDSFLSHVANIKRLNAKFEKYTIHLAGSVIASESPHNDLIMLCLLNQFKRCGLQVNVLLSPETKIFLKKIYDGFESGFTTLPGIHASYNNMIYLHDGLVGKNAGRCMSHATVSHSLYMLDIKNVICSFVENITYSYHCLFARNTTGDYHVLVCEDKPLNGNHIYDLLKSLGSILDYEGQSPSELFDALNEVNHSVNLLAKDYSSELMKILQINPPFGAFKVKTLHEVSAVRPMPLPKAKIAFLHFLEWLDTLEDVPAFGLYDNHQGLPLLISHPSELIKRHIPAQKMQPPAPLMSSEVPPPKREHETIKRCRVVPLKPRNVPTLPSEEKSCKLM